MKLTRNYSQEASRSSGAEWYTSRVGKLLTVHVYRLSPNQDWTARVNALDDFWYQKYTFDTKEAAFAAAKVVVETWLKAANEDFAKTEKADKQWQQ